MIGTFEYGDFSGHTPTNKVDEDYLISEATYTEPAIYNKSCSICGVVVAGVFTHGDPLVAKNGWLQEDGIWYYYEDGVKVKNTWRKDSVGWCYLGENGCCYTKGTYEVDGHEYTFDADGRIEGEPIQE